MTKTVHLNVEGAAVGSVIANFAAGGVARMGGLAMVGEHGRELVAMPRGARVLPAGDTAQIVRAATHGNEGPSMAGMKIGGRLAMVNGEAYIEGIVLEVLDDGEVIDDALTRRMTRP